MPVTVATAAYKGPVLRFELDRMVSLHQARDLFTFTLLSPRPTSFELLKNITNNKKENSRRVSSTSDSWTRLVDSEKGYRVRFSDNLVTSGRARGNEGICGVPSHYYFSEKSVASWQQDIAKSRTPLTLPLTVISVNSE
jgi:hypothetical protein